MITESKITQITELTKEEVIELHETPIDIIEAPGEGKAIILDEIQLYKPEGPAFIEDDGWYYIVIYYEGYEWQIVLVADDDITKKTEKTSILKVDNRMALLDVADNLSIKMAISGTLTELTGGTSIFLKTKYHIISTQTQ